MADSDPPQDPFEAFRRLWGPLGVPVPGMTMPTFDPQELEKRIAELRSVESWLQVNLNMVRFAVQGLEMQRAALVAMGAGAAAPGGVAPLFWPWAAAPAAKDPDKPKE